MTVTDTNQQAKNALHETGSSWDEPCSVTAINQQAKNALHENNGSADPYGFAAAIAFHKKLIGLNNWRYAKIADRNKLSEFPKHFYEAKLGKCCGQCGKSFDQSETVVITGLQYQYECSRDWHFQRYTVCENCAKDNSYSLTYICESCGRKILASEYEFKRGDCYCSKKCYWTVVNKRNRYYEMMLRSYKPNHCSVCNSAFIPNRTDSRYCSSKCRQKAYRQRKNEVTA